MNRRVLAWSLAPVVLLAGGWFGVQRIGRARPVVEREPLWIGTVERGPLTLSVRGPGTLVPVRIRWITSSSAGRVERIPVEPGMPIEPDTVLLELSNDDLVLKELEAMSELAASEAELVNLRAQLKTERLSQEAKIASVNADLQSAERTLAAHLELAPQGLVTALELASNQDRVAELKILLEIERQCLTLLDEVEEGRIAAQVSMVDRLRALGDFRRQQVADLTIKAESSGVLQELPAEIGQWVGATTLLAKVVQPDELKAELRIPQNQAKEIRPGQTAEIDTRVGMASGVVVRIEPSVQEGAVVVEVRLEGELPVGARPDMSVEGIILLEHLADVLHVKRPAYGQPNSRTTLFRLLQEDTLAERVQVELGRASARSIEILSGLEPGDRIVLSDMSRWEGKDRLRVE